jgi:hypothetical protein
MADEKTTTDKDKAGHEKTSREPLPPPDIKVDVVPNTEEQAPPRTPNRKHVDRAIEQRNAPKKELAEKVKKGLEGDVKRAVEEADKANRGKTQEQQRQARKDAQGKPAERVVEDLPPDMIKEIKVKVDGHETTHVPPAREAPPQGPPPPPKKSG